MGKFYFGIMDMIIIIDIGFIEVLIEAGGNNKVRLEYDD
jgi:hypothetical protein